MEIATIAAARRLVWAAGSLFLLVGSGCSHTITTPMAKLAPLAPGAPTIRIERAAVTDYGSVPAHTYASFDADLHNSLHANGRPQISGKSSAPLVHSEVNITSQQPRTHGFFDFWVAYFSFFVPPLGFIPMPAEIDYSVDYTLEDTAGREVMRGHITDTVRGKRTGWYIGRIDETVKLVKAAGKFAAENSARLVINDLRRNNIQLAAAADHYRSNPKLRGAELASAQERRNERERKLSEMARQSSRLMAAKRRSPSRSLATGLFRPAGPLTVPAAAVIQVRSQMPVAGLLRPAVVGPTSEMQEQILHNTMRSVLSKTHSVVSEAALDEARVAAAAALGHQACDQPACERLVLENLNADHRFTLRILREPSGAQLVVGVEEGGETISRSSYCDGCTTGGLDEQVTELTVELAKQVAPLPAAPAMAASPASMSPAMMTTGFTSSPASTVVGAVADVAKQCLAKTVAMQACGMVPGFGKLACRAIAQAKFSGLPCP